MNNVVYVIQNNYVPNQYKIGISSNWAKRSRQLKVGDVTTEIYVGNVIHNHQLEQQLHKRYASYRLPQSEWFHLNDEQLDDVVTTIGRSASYVPKPKIHTVYKERVIYVDRPVYVPQPTKQTAPKPKRNLNNWLFFGSFAAMGLSGGLLAPICAPILVGCAIQGKLSDQQPT